MPELDQQTFFLCMELCACIERAERSAPDSVQAQENVRAHFRLMPEDQLRALGKYNRVMHGNALSSMAREVLGAEFNYRTDQKMDRLLKERGHMTDQRKRATNAEGLLEIVKEQHLQEKDLSIVAAQGKGD